MILKVQKINGHGIINPCFSVINEAGLTIQLFIMVLYRYKGVSHER